MRAIIITLLLAVCFSACDKDQPNDLGGTDIGGKVYIENPYVGQVKKLLPGQKVLLINDTLAPITSYERSITANTDAVFSFGSVIADRSYRLYAELRQATYEDPEVVYTATVVSTPSESLELVLQPDFSKQNALYITCKDGSVAPGTIGGATIYLYTSPVLAALDAAAMNGVGAYDTLTTRPDGTAFKCNLPAVQLYANAYFETAAGRLKAAVVSMPLLGATKLGQATITLLP